VAAVSSRDEISHGYYLPIRGLYLLKRVKTRASLEAEYPLLFPSISAKNR
jgi:hypothetical protein